ncbi:MAG: FtsB family cell division protein [Alphaproteobacteria bacterium]
MQIRRRLSRGFGMLAIPAICISVTAYFAYSGIFGERGLLVWQDTSAKLAVKKQALGQLRAERRALEHRISLLDGKTIDPDLLDEVSRGVLFQGRPGEVAVPRDKEPRGHR